MNAPTSQSIHAETEDIDGRPQHANRLAFHVTLRAILARLPDRPGLKILEVGGGTGSYSFALAERGHSTTLVSISADCFAISGSEVARASPACNPGPARILHGEATRLANHPGLADEHGTFDAVLLRGPLSHIVSADLRAAALCDARDFVCPRGGVLFCGWVSRLAHYRRLALEDPKALSREQELDEESERDGLYVDSGEEKPRTRHYELPERMPEILRFATGVEDVEMVGAEGLLARGLDRMVNELQEEEFEAWVEKCFEVGTDEHGWRMADHIVGIAIKP